MKKLILSVVVTLFLTTAFAAEKPAKDPVALNDTYKEITKLLNNYSSFSGLEQDVIVKVRITINENNEIVVLSTNAANEDLNYYIKNTLNYQKLSSAELPAGRGLSFLVKFTK
ncbi:hypothetical protein [Flavobacterium seoulense]|uniref:TonB C-terminal domain-containing protein n=1 Tax=Flavobacterium seoulense TaxID=1492738 RepID=A0A066WZL1_9FLAO|nr:hypothetical protein [Flavobacterium seoulense]KDN56115.1 hypothetical protein FEM21_06670 [Flavobacterium seoulense]